MASSQESQLPAFDLSGFDFAAYEQELSAIDIESQAQAALSGILMVQSEDGLTRSFEQIKQEAEVFFDNPIITEMDNMVDRLAMQYAAFCMAHGEGAAAMNEGALGGVYTRGMRNIDELHSHGPEHGHTHNSEGTSSGEEKGKKKGRAQSIAQLLIALLAKKKA